MIDKCFCNVLIDRKFLISKLILLASRTNIQIVIRAHEILGTISLEKTKKMKFFLIDQANFANAFKML